MGRTLWVADRTAYVLLKLAILCIRIGWLITFGWLLAGLYLLPAFVMAPFRTTYSVGGGGSITETAFRIAWLKPAPADN